MPASERSILVFSEIFPYNERKTTKETSIWHKEDIPAAADGG